MIHALLLLVSCFAPAQVERGAPLPRSGFLGVQSAPAEGGKGVRVMRVLPGGAGESLALKEGDIVLSVNGTEVATPQQLAASVRSIKGGEALKLTLLRNDKETNLEGKMAPRPKQAEQGLEVIYDQVVSQGKRIRVIVTKPEGKGPFPAFFYIAGIGSFSLDGSFANIFPFAGKVLEPIARAGYVTVRIDKPGQGDSEGPVYKELGFGVEKDAYLQALRLTKTLPFVDPNRIAIFGHSMGGTFGPLVAAEEPVKAVIVIGTLFKTWGEYMLENSRRQSELAGASPDEVDRAERESLKAVHYIFNEGLSPKELAEKHPEMKGWLQGNLPDMETYSGVGVPFFRELSQTNVPAAWVKFGGDALAIYCENDFLCGQDDHERIAATMNKKRPGSGEFVLLTESDHLFRKTTSQRHSQQTWGQPGEFNPSIVETLLGYLKRKL